MDRSAPRVIFGGTFDPVHNGHLRTALELREWLQVPTVELVPVRAPVHRTPTEAQGADRMAMIQVATEHEPGLSGNDVELNSDQLSYTCLTLTRLREQLYEQTPLIMVLGMDAFLGLASWRDWQTIPELAHLLVVSRPGYHPDLDETLTRFQQTHQVESVDQLFKHPSGGLIFHELTPLGISSTHIRAQIRKGYSARYLLPESVWNYIQDKGLYGFKH